MNAANYVQRLEAICEDIPAGAQLISVDAQPHCDEAGKVTVITEFDTGHMHCASVESDELVNPEELEAVTAILIQTMQGIRALGIQ